MTIDNAADRSRTVEGGKSWIEMVTWKPPYSIESTVGSYLYTNEIRIKKMYSVCLERLALT
jgi:hypothetical protein